jgi:hypothetical protein
VGPFVTVWKTENGNGENFVAILVARIIARLGSETWMKIARVGLRIARVGFEM